jgi:hypothetical protein
MSLFRPIVSDEEKMIPNIDNRWLPTQPPNFWTRPLNHCTNGQNGILQRPKFLVVLMTYECVRRKLEEDRSELFWYSWLSVNELDRSCK